MLIDLEEQEKRKRRAREQWTLACQRWAEVRTEFRKVCAALKAFGDGSLIRGVMRLARHWGRR
jgi:hypothetical protein